MSESGSGGSRIVLVDTDVMSIAVLAHAVTGKRHPDAATWQDLLLGRRVVISVQTRVELLTWPLIRRWKEPRTRALRAAVDAVPLLQITDEVQHEYVELTAAAKRSGHAIGDKLHTGDRWIAATALARELPIASRDSIFDGIHGLEVLRTEP